MNKQPFTDTFRTGELVALANAILQKWVHVESHGWRSLYAWNSGKLYDNYGDVVGQLNANTIYIYRRTITPREDLFHELGHTIARRFNLIGHLENGFNGSWEKRQTRLIAQIQHGRHWSPVLQRVRRGNEQQDNTLTTALGSEIWAELFMGWYLYPDRAEREFIAPEMLQLADTCELASIDTLTSKMTDLK